jgi:hypothetical protein
VRFSRAIQDVLRFEISVNDIMRVKICNGVQDRATVGKRVSASRPGYGGLPNGEKYDKHENFNCVGFREFAFGKDSIKQLSAYGEFEDDIVPSSEDPSARIRHSVFDDHLLVPGFKVIIHFDLYESIFSQSVDIHEARLVGTYDIRVIKTFEDLNLVKHLFFITLDKLLGNDPVRKALLITNLRSEPIPTHLRATSLTLSPGGGALRHSARTTFPKAPTPRTW